VSATMCGRETLHVASGSLPNTKFRSCFGLLGWLSRRGRWPPSQLTMDTLFWVIIISALPFAVAIAFADVLLRRSVLPIDMPKASDGGSEEEIQLLNASWPPAGNNHQWLSSDRSTTRSAAWASSGVSDLASRRSPRNIIEAVQIPSSPIEVDGEV